MKQTNEKVKTPLGEGRVQGGFMVKQMENSLRAVLVRIPLTDAVRAQLAKPNCITPRATVSALFVFAESELA